MARKLARQTLTLTEKRHICWLAECEGAPQKSIALAYKVTPRYIQMLLKANRKHAWHAFHPCWTCGNESAAPDAFCNDECESKWNAAFEILKEKGQAASIVAFRPLYCTKLDAEKEQLFQQFDKRL